MNKLKDGIYYYFKDKKYWGYMPVDLPNKSEDNQSKEHFFLKHALKKIIEVHCDAICETEKAVDGMRFDVFGERNSKSEKVVFVGEIGKIHCPSRLILNRLKDMYEFADIWLWIPLVEGNEDNYSVATPYELRLFDYFHNGKEDDMICNTCETNAALFYKTQPFGINNPFICFDGKAYRHFGLNLQHAFDSEKWHLKNDKKEKLTRMTPQRDLLNWVD